MSAEQQLPLGLSIPVRTSSTDHPLPKVGSQGSLLVDLSDASTSTSTSTSSTSGPRSAEFSGRVGKSRVPVAEVSCCCLPFWRSTRRKKESNYIPLKDVAEG